MVVVGHADFCLNAGEECMSKETNNGIDILRIADDKIVEYWVSSDGMYLMQQLGVIT